MPAALLARTSTAGGPAASEREGAAPDRQIAREPASLGAGTGAAALLTVASGILYGISFPPLALRPLAWISLVPLLIAIRAGSVRRALLLGALWACVMTYVTSDCLPGAVINYYKQPPLVGWLMLLGATLLTMVPYYGSFAVAYWLLSRRPDALLPLVTGAAWVGAEFARVRVLGGNPWALSGYSQTGVTTLMQVGDLAGVHGVGFLLAATNAALVELLLASRSDAARRPTARRAALAVGVALAAAVAYGHARLAPPVVPAHADDAAPMRVAIAQGNLDLGLQWNPEMYGTNLRDYLRLTQEAADDGDTRLVFWPESAMTFRLTEEPSYQREIGRVLEAHDLQLVAGGPRATFDPGEAIEIYFNTTFLLSPEGEILAWQDKTKLLPFAEYFPLDSVDLLRRDFGGASQFTPGVARPPLPTRAGAAGVIVCNETMYPEIARARVASGAEYLVNPANDSWFGALKYSLQAFDIARWRAVETRRFLVRASTAGPSAIVDPFGRVVVATEPFTRAWIAGDVRARRDRTVYQSVGDAFAWICALTAILACGAAVASRRA